MSPRIVIAALLSAVAALALMATGAQANVPIYSLASATSSTQAGAHADTVLEVEVGVRGKTEPVTLPCVCNTMRDLKVNTPAGLIAAPGNVPRCTAAEFAILRCPVDSQLGLAVVAFPASDDPSNGWYHFEPLYNMQAGEDQLALLATPQPLSQTPVYIDVTSRTESDYGLEFKTFGIPSILPPNIITTIFWGVPADPIHDPVRFPFFGTKYRGCGNFGGYNPTPLLLANVNPATDGPCGDGWDAVAANSPVVPFVQNPTACLGPTLFTADVLAYDLETTHAEASFPAMTGCDQLSFDPTLAAKPTTTEADSPSGLDVDLTVPQTLSPTTPTSSAIRASTVTLPAGFTINSNAADGKLACTDAQARFGTREQAQCPEHAKVGTLEVESTQFPSLLRGAMYLGEPLPGDRYRIFWSFDGFGLHVKLAGTVVPDPRTGQLVTTFTDLPQFNFQRFNLHFFGAERGALATPERCGTYRVHAEFTPWAFPAVPKQTSTQFFTIDSGPGERPVRAVHVPSAPPSPAGSPTTPPGSTLPSPSTSPAPMGISS